MKVPRALDADQWSPFEYVLNAMLIVWIAGLVMTTVQHWSVALVCIAAPAFAVSWLIRGWERYAERARRRGQLEMWHTMRRTRLEQSYRALLGRRDRP